MTEITILVSPAFDRRGKRRHDRFDARLKDGDDVVCEATRQPLLDSSRVFLGKNFCPSSAICMVHAHAPAVVAMRAQIGVAARYDVMCEKFVRRKPQAGLMSGSTIENPPSRSPWIDRRGNAALEAAGSLNTTNTSSAAPSPALSVTSNSRKLKSRRGRQPTSA
jgi:hypothetical protein